MAPVDKRDVHHEGTEHLAFNNTRLNRFLTLLALKTTARFWPWDGVCIPVSKHKIVKTGRWVHLTEAATMKFVAENTSLPVPKVYCSFVRKNQAYIVMEKIQGEEIPKAWAKLSQTSREKLFAHLRRLMAELRSLKPPQSTEIQSRAGSSLYDWRILSSHQRFGPFKSIQEFHSWARNDLQMSEIENRRDIEDWENIKAMAEKQDGEWPPPVFTMAT